MNKKIKVTPKKSTKKVVDAIKKAAETPVDLPEEFDFGKVISTGSTLLDLAISGKRIRGGGIPGGILMSIQGKSSSGKSALLAEMAASTEIRGGSNRFIDTEARLDKQFAKIFGMNIPNDQILLTDTVEEMFKDFIKWKPDTTESINLYSVDSLSALCSELEMTKDGDKRGQKKPKILSEQFRKTARMITKRGLIIACTNQLRQDKNGRDVVSGGNAQIFHSSLSLSMKPKFGGGGARWTVEKKFKTKSGKEKLIEKQIGGYTEVQIIKSSIDDPFRKCIIYIRYDRGIDDVSANLQYIKEMTSASSYDVYDKTYAGREVAAKYIEDHEYEERLRDDVITMWEQIEMLFASKRKPKRRI